MGKVEKLWHFETLIEERDFFFFFFCNEKNYSIHKLKLQTYEIDHTIQR